MASCGLYTRFSVVVCVMASAVDWSLCVVMVCGCF